MPRARQELYGLSGHEDPDEWPSDYAQALVAFGGTIVVVMGAKRISRIAARLVEEGLAPETPVVAVRSATTKPEEVRRATLGTIGDALLAAPSIFVIGNAAGLDLRCVI